MYDIPLVLSCLEFLQGSSWSIRRKNSKRCPTQRGPAGTGISSTPWSTTPPWWEPGSTSCARPQRALWTGAWTAAPRRGARRRQQPRRQQPRRRTPLPANEHERDLEDRFRVSFGFGASYKVTSFAHNKCTNSPVPHVEIFTEPFFVLLLLNWLPYMRLMCSSLMWESVCCWSPNWRHSLCTFRWIYAFIWGWHHALYGSTWWLDCTSFPVRCYHTEHVQQNVLSPKLNALIPLKHPFQQGY